MNCIVLLTDHVTGRGDEGSVNCVYLQMLRIILDQNIACNFQSIFIILINLIPSAENRIFLKFFLIYKTSREFT